MKCGRAADIRPCISCMRCIESLMAAHEDPFTPMVCSVNAEAGRECELPPLEKDGQGRVVAIVGSGPAPRGPTRAGAPRLKPVVLEKGPEPGGQLLLAERPPKWRLKWLREWFVAQLEQLGVEIRCNCEATPGSSTSSRRLRALGRRFRLRAAWVHPGLDSELVLTPSSSSCRAADRRRARGRGWFRHDRHRVRRDLADNSNFVELYEMVEQIGPGIFFRTSSTSWGASCRPVPRCSRPSSWT